MTYWQAYLILVHVLAFNGLCLFCAIARHVYLSYHKHRPEPETFLAAETIVHNPHGLRIVR